MTTIYEDVIAIQSLIDEFETKSQTYEQDAQKDVVIETWLLETKKQILSSGLEKLCKVRANYLSDLEAFKKEEERIKTKRDSLSKSFDRLEGYISSILYESKTRKQQAGTFTVSFRKSSSVFIDPNNFNDERFIRTE